MKTIAVTSAILLSAASIDAAEIFKADNTDALNLTTSYVGNTVPTADDWLLWHPLTTTDQVAIGGDVSIYGLDATMLGGVATLKITGTSGATLTIGAGGILTDNTGKGIELSSNIGLSADQTWSNIRGSMSLTASGSSVSLNGHTLRVANLTETKANINGPGRLVIDKGSAKFSNGVRTPSVDVTVLYGSTLHWNGSSSENRTDAANSVTLNSLNNSAATLTAAGSSSRNGFEYVSGALTAECGIAEVVISPNADKSQKVEFGSLSIDPKALLRVRGTQLGKVLPSAIANSGACGLYFGTAPTMIGGIIPGMIVSDESYNGSATGLAVYDSDYGVRALGSTDYETSLVSGGTHVNVRIESGSGEPVQIALGAGTTTVNSLMLDTFSHAKGDGGIQIEGEEGAVLKIKSGMIYARHAMSDVEDTSDAFSVKGMALDLDGQPGRIVARVQKQDNMKEKNSVNLDLAICNDDGNGVTYVAEYGQGAIRLVGTQVSTYTGPTRVVSGSVQFGKSGTGMGNDRFWAIPGNLYVYGGNCQNKGHQLKDDASVFVYGGNYKQKGGDWNSGSGADEVFSNLTIYGGTATLGNSGTSSGSTTMNDAFVLGGTFRGDSAHTLKMQRLVIDGGVAQFGRWSSYNSHRGRYFVQGGISITNVATGAYSPILFDAGAYDSKNGQPIPAGSMYLSQGVNFCGNSTNDCTVWIDSAVPAVVDGVGQNPWPKICLAEASTFNVGDGAADVDLAVRPVVVDADIDVTGAAISASGGIVKTGAGTLMLANTNTYSLATQVQAGRLIADGALAGDVTVAAGATFRGGDMSESGALAVGGNITFAQDAKLEFDPGAATTVAGDVVFGGVEMVLKDGAEITEDVLVMKARSFSGVVSGKFGKFVTRYRNGGTELWLGKDKGMAISIR